MSTVEALALKDYNAASAAVIGFFGTGDGEAAPN
jgi:hypothetical protein